MKSILNKSKGYERFLEILPSKERARFFVYFILLSLTFWTSTKLSNSFTLEQSFPIKWINIPKGYMLPLTNQQINASITASGVDIFLYRLLNKTIEISLSQANFSGNKGQVNLLNQQFLIQKQFFDNTKLDFINPGFLTFDFNLLGEKLLPIDPKVQINLRAGYLLDSDVKIIPDSILIRGSNSILDTLTSIKSKLIILNDVHENLKRKVSLQSVSELELLESKTTLHLAVSRYSEKEFTLNINVVNLPNGIRVKLFPPKAKVRVTLPLSILRTVKASDFNLVVDYNSILQKEDSQLKLKIIGKPPAVKKLTLNPKKVNYLIRK